MAFTETLTVRIEGDSSQLKSELQSVANELRALKGQLEDLSNSGEQIGRSFGRLSSAVRPLEQLSQMLSRVTGQAQALSQIPITVNVQPAMLALAQLSQMIQMVAAQLVALAAMPIGAGGGGVGPGGGPIRRFAAGGLVTGPPGTDMVPALLTAGEFVLSRRATEALGASFLQAVNAMPGARSTGLTTREATSRVQSTTNHFGGITINVAEAGGVNAIVRDLRLQGVHLRNRRG